MSLYLVYLRRPRNTADRRSDPFWEFGSFGITGCHGKNLLHRLRSPLRAGDQLAFLQGGIGEVRITGLTPPITVQQLQGRIYATWSKAYRPCPFERAPLLIDNNNGTDFPAVHKMLAKVNRTTPCGRAGSLFRARTARVEGALAEQIRSFFSLKRPRIKQYLDAVAPTDDPWRRHGNAKGWGNRSEREKEYARLGGGARLSTNEPRRTCR